MSGWLIAIVAAIYAAVAVDHANAKHVGKTLIWTGYVIANIGFILDEAGI